MSSVLAVAAATWGVLMALAPLLQVRAMIRARSSRDVSIGYLAVLLVGFALWFAYGASIGNVAIVITNVVALVMGAGTIGCAWYLRRRPARPLPVPSNAVR
ncbi:MAG TPA: SemiSWEET family transporter [Ilumatobacter sp.]|nr:SemiSWEET family transporter [Ilumatobacter sp.]